MNIFQNQTKSVPTKDEQIVRVTMEQNDIGGRKDNMPSQPATSGDMSIKHVPNQG